MKKFNAAYSELITEMDLSDPREITPAVLAKAQDILVACKMYIYNYAPFASAILQKMNVVFTTDIPTMAVDNVGNIYINPYFGVEEIKKQEFLGVVIHECMHILNDTFSRQLGRDHEVWNICTDYIMNRDIIADGYKLPKGGCIPDANGDIKTKVNGVDITVNVSHPKRSAEWLYKQFDAVAKKHHKKKKPGSGDPGEDGSGDPGAPGEPGESGGNIEMGEKSLDEHINVKKGEGQPKPVNGSPAPVKREDMGRVLDRAIEEAKIEVQRREAGDQSSGGKASAMSGTIITLARPFVDWKSILRELVRKVIGSYTWAKPDKRALASGYYAPRRTTVETVRKICIAIDTSGSIGRKQLAAYITEIANIFKLYPQSKFIIALWATETYFHVELTRDNINSILGTLTKNWRTGGNDLDTLIPYLTKYNLIADLYGIVVIGDGWFAPATNIPHNIHTIYLIDDAQGVTYLEKYKPNPTVYFIKIDK